MPVATAVGDVQCLHVGIGNVGIGLAYCRQFVGRLRHGEGMATVFGMGGSKLKQVKARLGSIDGKGPVVTVVRTAYFQVGGGGVEGGSIWLGILVAVGKLAPVGITEHVGYGSLHTRLVNGQLEGSAIIRARCLRLHNDAE